MKSYHSRRNSQPIIKKLINLSVTFLLMISFNAGAQENTQPDPNELLKKIDENMSADTRHFKATMVIHGKRASRTIRSESWAEGEKKAFTQYLSPPREKGTKMLKLDKKLWIFSPSSDRTIRISGHMLRQSVMGSDLSYEDMMEDSKLFVNYHGKLEGEVTINDRSAWVLKLTAKTDKPAYSKRKLWVDKEKIVPLQQETYAKSGKLLKKMTTEDLITIGKRTFPKKLIFKDMLKKGKGTEFIFETIEFDIPIPPHIFSKASLRK